MNESDFIPYATSASLGTGPVLVLAPHPDDEVFGCAGALIQHAAAGDAIRVIIATDGAWMEDREYATLRREESRAAAAVLGYGEPVFWDFPDRSLHYGEHLIRRVLESIAESRAELVYAPSTREIHPDHRALALAAAEAVRRSDRSIQLVMYEVGTPLQPNRLLDITGVCERKQAAMACFVSQMERQSYGDHVTALNRFRTYTLPPEVALAEGYRIVAGDDLRADPATALRQETFAAPGWTIDSTLGMPLVSIVICSNGRPSLRDTLDDVALQTYPHIEIIVVTPHGSAQALPQWWGRFPVTSVSLASSSRADGFNTGMQRAAGVYMALLDEGDRLRPDHITSLIELLLESDVARCVIAGIGIAAGDRFSLGGITVPAPQDLLVGSPVPLHAAVFERSLFQHGCRFDPELEPAEDWDFLLQLGEQTPLRACSRATFDHQRTGRRDSETSSDVARVAKGTAKFHQKWTIDPHGQPARCIGDNSDKGDPRATTPQRVRDDDLGDVDAARQRATEWEGEVQHLRLRVVELEAALLKAQQDNAALSSWGSGLQQALDRITHSTSWSITRPLRFLARMVRSQ